MQSKIFVNIAMLLLELAKENVQGALEAIKELQAPPDQGENSEPPEAHELRTVLLRQDVLEGTYGACRGVTIQAFTQVLVEVLAQGLIIVVPSSPMIEMLAAQASKGLAVLATDPRTPKDTRTWAVNTIVRRLSESIPSVVSDLSVTKDNLQALQLVSHLLEYQDFHNLHRAIEEFRGMLAHAHGEFGSMDTMRAPPEPQLDDTSPSPSVVPIAANAEQGTTPVE